MGSSGMYTLSGGSISTGVENIGVLGTATFSQSGGTNTTGVLAVGNGSTPSATYTLSGTGVVNVGTEFIGETGRANLFNQTGGTQNITGNMYIGYNAGQSGTYTLSGGSASVSLGVTVGGGNGSGFFGMGTLTVSGTGVLNVGGVLIALPNTGTSVNLNGGTINAGGLEFFGAYPGLFNWTSGTLNLVSSITWDPASLSSTTPDAFGPALTLGNNQTLIVTGNETLGGSAAFALTLNSGSTHNVTGTLTISPTGTITLNDGSTLNAATIIASRRHLNGTLQNQGNFSYRAACSTADCSTRAL